MLRKAKVFFCFQALALLFLGLFCFGPDLLLAAWGKRGMVASEHTLASGAGVEILRQGGNAVDAAVATAFALGVVHPSSCGIGGGGFMIVHLTEPNQTYVLDYREKAPKAASRSMFVRNGQVQKLLSRRGALSVAVPGEVAGLALALERFGTLPLSVVMEPAIRYAREGFPVGGHLAKMIARNKEKIQKYPALAKIFLKSDGSPYQEGERLLQPDLAKTLKLIAQKGPKAFYEGEIARALAQTLEQKGGILTLADLAHYRPVWREALVGEFRDYTILTMPPPGGGGILLEMLHILSSDRLEDLGWASPSYLHLLAETMKHAFADRAQYYGDPDFVSVPLDTLLSRPYAQRLRKKISPAHTYPPQAYGLRVPSSDQGISHFSVVDRWGNAVACTTTINTAFGSMIVAEGWGVILNNEMDDFSLRPGVANVFGLVGSEANAIAPGKRPLSSMTPTLVLKQGRPLVVLGGSGGPFITTGVLQVLLNLLVFGQDVDQAVLLPRIHHQWIPNILFVEPGIPPKTRTALEQKGHQIREIPTMAAVQAIKVTPQGFYGVSDGRKGGEAVGW